MIENIDIRYEVYLRTLEERYIDAKRSKRVLPKTSSCVMLHSYISCMYESEGKGPTHSMEVRVVRLVSAAVR